MMNWLFRRRVPTPSLPERLTDSLERYGTDTIREMLGAERDPAPVIAHFVALLNQDQRPSREEIRTALRTAIAAVYPEVYTHSDEPHRRTADGTIEYNPYRANWLVALDVVLPEFERLRAEIQALTARLTP